MVEKTSRELNEVHRAVNGQVMSNTTGYEYFELTIWLMRGSRDLNKAHRVVKRQVMSPATGYESQVMSDYVTDWTITALVEIHPGCRTLLIHVTGVARDFARDQKILFASSLSCTWPNRLSSARVTYRNTFWCGLHLPNPNKVLDKQESCSR